MYGSLPPSLARSLAGAGGCAFYDASRASERVHPLDANHSPGVKVITVINPGPEGKDGRGREGRTASRATRERKGVQGSRETRRRRRQRRLKGSERVRRAAGGGDEERARQG